MSVWVVGLLLVDPGRENEAVTCKNDVDKNHSEEEIVYSKFQDASLGYTFNDKFPNFKYVNKTGL